ncbi:MAG TPA: hypothetical protein VF521_03480, partial [Pyrinomonadaceae bacterium]
LIIDRHSERPRNSFERRSRKHPGVRVRRARKARECALGHARRAERPRTHHRLATAHGLPQRDFRKRAF